MLRRKNKNKSSNNTTTGDDMKHLFKKTGMGKIETAQNTSKPSIATNTVELSQESPVSPPPPQLPETLDIEGNDEGFSECFKRLSFMTPPASPAPSRPTSRSTRPLSTHSTDLEVIASMPIIPLEKRKSRRDRSSSSASASSSSLYSLNSLNRSSPLRDGSLELNRISTVSTDTFVDNPATVSSSTSSMESMTPSVNQHPLIISTPPMESMPRGNDIDEEPAFMQVPPTPAPSPVTPLLTQPSPTRSSSSSSSSQPSPQPIQTTHTQPLQKPKCVVTQLSDLMTELEREYSIRTAKSFVSSEHSNESEDHYVDFLDNYDHESEEIHASSPIALSAETEDSPRSPSPPTSTQPDSMDRVKHRKVLRKEMGEMFSDEDEDGNLTATTVSSPNTLTRPLKVDVVADQTASKTQITKQKKKSLLFWKKSKIRSKADNEDGVGGIKGKAVVSGNTSSEVLVYDGRKTKPKLFGKLFGQKK